MKQMQQAVVPPELAGQRLDAVAARLFPEFSRARLALWIREGLLTISGRTARPRDAVQMGDALQLQAVLEETGPWAATPGPLEIIFSDEDLIVLNKPADLVVHPAAGHQSDTLVNRLLHVFPGLATLPRAGIVHRLDKDTTGVMVVAHSLRAHHALVKQLQDRSMGRVYEALVYGEPVSGGTIDAPLGRHPRQRMQRAVVAGGKPAVTEYRVLKRYCGLTLLQCRLATGRTHQIRVHLAHIGYPIVGDSQYNQGARLPKGLAQESRQALQTFPRQALHARTLHLVHPASDSELSFQVPPATDMQGLLDALPRRMKEL